MTQELTPERIAEIAQKADRSFVGYAGDGLTRVEFNSILQHIAQLEAQIAKLTAGQKPWLVCADCGLPYSDDGWADFVVSDETWAKLTAEDNAGVLCACCMVRRAVRLGIEDPTGRFASGPFCDSAKLTAVKAGGEMLDR